MAATKLPTVRSADELEALVHEIGFLPLVPTWIEGFSVKDCTPRDMWFVRDVEGPWEWREIIADRGEIAYGKLMRNKIAFVSPAFYPDFVNWRRGGMDFEERYAMGLIPRGEKELYGLLETNGPMLTRELRPLLGAKELEKASASLQMRTDITIQRFEYRRDAFGWPYGNASARLAISDSMFPDEMVYGRFEDAPEVSLRRLMDHVAGLFPQASEQKLMRALR